MHDLAPLRLALPELPAWEHAAIPVTRIDDLRASHVKVGADRASALAVRLGFADPCRITAIGLIECLWLGPGEWLLLAPSSEAEALAEVARKALENRAAVIEMQDGLVVLDLSADVELVAGLTGLPRQSLATGRTARTRLADIPATIAAGSDTRFLLLFDRTYAPHVRAWLDRAI